MRYTLFSLALAIAISPFQSKGEPESKKSGSTGLFITVPFEFPIINNGAFNNALAVMGLPDSRVPIISAGLAVEGRLNDIVFSAGYTSGNRKPKFTSLEQINTYTQANINIGYDILESPYRSLYPYLGVKICAFKYEHNVKFPNTSSPSYFQYFTTSLDHKELEHSKIMLDLGIGYSLQRTYYVGLRGGGLIGLSRDHWAINNSTVPLNGGPSLNYTAYITLSLGVGFVERDTEKKKKRKDSDKQDM
jgi:hypothetical protein